MLLVIFATMSGFKDDGWLRYRRIEFARNGRHLYAALCDRPLSLFGAKAASVPAIETVFPRIDATDALANYVACALRDGFTGLMAIHPAQVAIINAGFSPTAAELARAQAIVAAFAAHPGVGALKIDGKMVDRPPPLASGTASEHLGAEASIRALRPKNVTV